MRCEVVWPDMGLRCELEALPGTKRCAPHWVPPARTRRLERRLRKYASAHDWTCVTCASAVELRLVVEDGKDVLLCAGCRSSRRGQFAPRPVRGDPTMTRPHRIRFFRVHSIVIALYNENENKLGRTPTVSVIYSPRYAL